MGLFKSDEDKAAEAAQKAEQDQQAAAQRAAQQAEAERQQFLRSPVGMATTAKEQGLAFFEIQLSVARHEREAFFGDRNARANDSTVSAGGVLGQIEAVGWRLEHVGYVYMVTGESSSDKVFLSGMQTAVSGQVVGIYLFRNTDGAQTAASAAGQLPTA